MNQLSHSWCRPDPTFRRYLEAVRPQGQLLPAPSHASPKRMIQQDDFFTMTHQSKKKRVDDDSLAPDAGAKPVQLQRRRVWRACESCRQVDRVPSGIIFLPRRRLIISIAGARKSSATAVSPLALSVRLLDRSALGFRLRTERL
jgi:hypothetical protein